MELDELNSSNKAKGKLSLEIDFHSPKFDGLKVQFFD
jgi:hypothetical protein